MKIKSLLLVFLCFFLLTLNLPINSQLQSEVYAESQVKNRSFNEEQEDRADITRNAILATVRILTGTSDANGFRGQASGSGVIITSEGLVLTNRHVVFAANGNALYPEIWAGVIQPGAENLPPRRAFRLKLIEADPNLDLALLRITFSKPEKVNFSFLRLAPEQNDLSYGSSLRVIGFPVAGGPTTTVVRTSVVGLDDREGWIKVEGSLMRGVSGGAAINSRGELVGLATKVEIDQPSPFLGEDGLPDGVILGTVGFIRSTDEIATFLAKVAGGSGGAGGSNTTPIAPNVVSNRIEVSGVVLDSRTKKPIVGASIGIINKDQVAEDKIELEDLIATSRTDQRGAFTLNRRLKPGVYKVKIVHRDYITFVKIFDVKPTLDQLLFSLIKE